MNRRLGLIAVVSLGISAACVLAALSLAPNWVGDEESWARTLRSCAAMKWVGKASRSTGQDQADHTVDLEWPGGDAVKINIPARVHYQPGPKAQASVSGDAELVGHLRLRDGTLEWDTIDNCFPADDLVVRLTGPAVKAWTLNGSGKLDLTDIRQDVLRIVLRGSGTVTASGAAQETSLDVAGSSRIDLSKLVTQHANAHIRGSAEVELAPREQVDISIAGSAVVRLHGAGAARVSSRISGSGQIKQVP
jgi:Putative auto-transporter adhesin, head GIN domain